MLPWNINHFRPIKAQLEDGIRFLHLKICNFGVPGGEKCFVGILLGKNGTSVGDWEAPELRGILEVEEVPTPANGTPYCPTLYNP